MASCLNTKSEVPSWLGSPWSGLRALGCKETARRGVAWRKLIIKPYQAWLWELGNGNIRNRAAETNFNLELPDGYDDSEDNHWTASLNDSRETVVEFPGEDNHWTASNRFEPVEVSQEDRDKEEHTSGSVKRLKEFVNSVSDLEIKTAIDMIKNAKETDNHAQGLISRNTDFRSAKVETFLFDTDGAANCT